MKTLRTMLASLVVLLALQAHGQTPEERGRVIAEEADRQDLGWHDNMANMRMLLRNRHGQTSTRELRRHALEITAAGLGDRSLIIFETPRDIKGTALLSHTKILDSDDQWLYLPALKRVKRISSKNKSGPFVGSEFAFEDLVSQEVDKYEYKWLRDEPCGELDCFVVERVPQYKNSGYTLQVIWWDKAEYRPQRIEFYDRKGDLLKTLTYEGYREYLGSFWRADLMRMENHQNGKSTDLVFDTWEFQNGQQVAMFSPARLKRTR